MNAQSVLTFGREALTLLLMISLPVLLTVMAVGLVVSIFQAVTQINENTSVSYTHLTLPTKRIV